jgi:hypothetical protein
MTKQIPLTQGQVALVDDWRYEELKQWKWQAQWDESAQCFYATRREGKGPFRRAISMHRQIMNTPKGMQCDHRNHDTLDNQEHNLRNATNSQNQMNKGVQSNNKLGEKCISPHPDGYRVQVHKDGEVVFNTTFRSLDDARLARDEAIEKYHGEFAYIPK